MYVLSIQIYLLIARIGRAASLSRNTDTLNTMRYMYYYQTPVGKIGIAEENGAITNLWFPTDPLPVTADLWETPVLKRAAKQRLLRRWPSSLHRPARSAGNRVHGERLGRAAEDSFR